MGLDHKVLGMLCFIILLASVTSYSLVIPQRAYSYPASIEGIGLKWSDLHFMICVINSADHKYEEIFIKALEEWKKVWPHFTYDIGELESCNIDILILKDYASYQDAGFLGTMKPTYTYSSEFVSAEIIIPTKDKFYVMEKGYCCREVFLERSEKEFFETSLHEFGHALGLGHSEDSGEGPFDIMDAKGAPDKEYIVSSMTIDKLDEIYGSSTNAKDYQVKIKPTVILEAEIDKDTYLSEDTMHISGKVSEIGGTSNVLLIELLESEFGPFSMIHTLTSFKPDHDGNFNLDLKLNVEISIKLEQTLEREKGISKVERTGVWILLIQYMGASEEIAFKIKEVPYEIQARTEKMTYTTGDLVMITGNVTRYADQVFITAINPEGISFTTLTVPISSDREFEANFILKETRFTIDGTWTIRLSYADDITTEIKFDLGKSARTQQQVDKIEAVTTEEIVEVRVQAKQIKDIIIIRVRNMPDSTIEVHEFKVSLSDSILKAFKGARGWTKEALLDNAAIFSTLDDPIKAGDKRYFLLKVHDVKPLVNWEVYSSDRTSLTEGSVTPFLR